MRQYNALSGAKNVILEVHGRTKSEKGVAVDVGIASSPRESDGVSLIERPVERDQSCGKL